MIDNRTNHYPIIRINRAHISQTDNFSLKIRIDYSLNLTRPGFNGTKDVITDYLNSPEARDGVNISFMVLDDRNESLVREFFNYPSLINTMLNRHSDDRFARFDETGGWQSIPLRDALLQSSDLELRTTVTDMGGESHYETYNFIEFEYRLHDFFSNIVPGQSVFQETAGTDLSSLDNTSLKAGLHLVAFMEMPYMTYIQSLVNTPEELKSFPITEMVYERLLQPTGNGALRPPQSRKIYFINDNNPDFSNINGLPYTGPAFFTNGFWYAGTDGNIGPRLQIRVVPNTKVSVDAPPLASESLLPAFNQSLRQEVGQDLEDYIRSNQSTSLFTSRSKIAELMVADSIAAMSHKKNHFIEPWSYKHTWITAVDDEVDGQLGSSYNCIFGIKYYDLIKNNTSFGGLMDYHYGLQDRRSKDIVRDIYKKTKIMNMRITRRRLSHDAFNNNDQCAPTYTDFEENQSNPVIIQTADYSTPGIDFLVAGIRKVQNAQASIEEVRLNLEVDENSTQENTINELTREEIEQGTFVTRSDLLTRSFMIKDYELYYNLDHGKYTYDVEVIIKDGSRELLEEYISKLRTAIRGYSSQIAFLSAAVIRNPAGQIEQGFYDYQVRRFFGVTAGDAVAFASRVNRLLQDINTSVYFLTGRVPFPGHSQQPGTEFFEMISRLDPRSGTTRVEDMEFLREESNKILSSLEGLLESAFLKQKSPKPSSYVEVHVPNATANNSSFIFAKAKTGIIHDAEDTSKLVTDFGIYGGLDQFLRRARAEAFSDDLQTELPPTSTPPIVQDFPTPYGDIVPPLRPEIDFNLEYMEPLSFLTLNAPRLDIATPLFTLPTARLQLEGTLDPITNPIRKPMQSYENTFQPASAPYATSRAAVRVTKTDFINSNFTQKSIKENKILALASPGSHLMGLASKDPSFDARHIPSSVGNIDVFFGGKAFNSDYREVAKFAIQKLPLKFAALTDDLKKTIIDELIDSVDVEQFTTRIEDNYKELSDMRDHLGDVYSMFNRLMSLGDFAIKTNIFSKTQETRFKFGLEKDTTEIVSEYNKDPFQKKRANLVSFDLKGNTVKHASMTKATQGFRSNRTLKRKTKIKEVKLFKLEVNAVKDNIATVNNAVLVERL